MTVQTELIATLTEDAKRMLTETQELPQTIVVYRGNNQVAIIALRASNANDLMAVAITAARGYSADTLALIMDTYTTDERTSPITGKPWAANEMEDIALNYDGVALGYVHDAITIQVVNRAGDITVTSIPYLKTGDAITYPGTVRTAHAGDPTTRPGGPLVDALTKIMNEPDALTSYIRAGHQMPPEAYPGHSTDILDCATTHALMATRQVIVGLLGDPGTPRAETIERHLGYPQG